MPGVKGGSGVLDENQKKKKKKKKIKKKIKKKKASTYRAQR
jgi:hypothetical protein